MVEQKQCSVEGQEGKEQASSGKKLHQQNGHQPEAFCATKSNQSLKGRATTSRDTSAICLMLVNLIYPQRRQRRLPIMLARPTSSMVVTCNNLLSNGL